MPLKKPSPSADEIIKHRSPKTDLDLYKEIHRVERFYAGRACRWNRVMLHPIRKMPVLFIGIIFAFDYGYEYDICPVNGSTLSSKEQIVEENIKMKLKIVLESRDKGGFKAYIPSLPGCISSGMSEDEALENIRSASMLHFGIEEVICPENRIDAALCKDMLTSKMSEEKKLAALTTLTGLFLMMSVIWTAGFFS